MNYDIIKTLFPDMAERIKDGKCPTCDALLTIDEFRDQLSVKEFYISGMCQKCQDDVFDH